MRIIPVIDLMGGQVVHAIAGRRSDYRPLRSNIVASTDPVEVAKALIDLVQPEELYLADLDAIGGAEPAWEVYKAIKQVVPTLLVDAGYHLIMPRGGELIQGIAEMVVGMESLLHGEELEYWVDWWHPRSITLSLDLRGGRLLDDGAGWNSPADQPIIVVDRVYKMGIRHIIVLDLERVGVGRGTGTEHLCHAIKQAYPDMVVIAGGGIRNREDADRLAHVGVDAVLVASALHSGTW